MFRGGLVVYATDLKATLAGVTGGSARRARTGRPGRGGRACGRGARERCGADWGLATTGVAGPTQQDGIAVGTVFVAVSGAVERRAGVAAQTATGRRSGGARSRAAIALLSTIALDAR